MNVIEDAIANAKRNPRTVVLPEGTEDRIIDAARRLVEEEIAHPILLGNPEDIHEQAAGRNLSGICLIDPENADNAPAYAEQIAARREKMKPALAAKLLKKPLYFGAAMVAAGDARTMVAGVACPTRRVIEAALMAIGQAGGIATPSSFFIMQMRDGTPYIFADCGLNVDPDASELADIAISSSQSARSLTGTDPRVALLSFSTKGSGAHESVDKVAEALKLVQDRAPDLLVDGELQADTAISLAVASKKGVDGPVAGQANVLVFPDLNSGNIAYKLVQHLAGARAIGPILQGFAKPVCDLSRGAGVDDIVAGTAVMLALDGDDAGSR